MKILLLVPGFNFGGAENHVRDLANSMDDAGNDVFVISKPGLQKNRLNSSVRFVSLKMKDIFLPFHLIYICFFIKRNRIDIIHAHKRLAIFLGCVAGKLMRIPVVVTVHGNPHYDLRTRISGKWADRVIFVSKRHLDGNGIYKRLGNKSAFIQNGVKWFENDSERDLNLMTYISRIDSRHAEVIIMLVKEVLPRVLRDFPAIKFNVIGDGKSLENIRKEADALNISNNREICVVHGYVPEVEPMIRRSGLVLGVGRAAIYSLALGIPVISINQQHMGGFVSEENYRFYQENNFVAKNFLGPDTDLLAGMLREYLADTGRFQKEAAILQNYVRTDFSLETMTIRILEIYDSLIRASGGKN